MSLEEKQKYLRENILEKGLDHQQFIEFIQTHSEDTEEFNLGKVDFDDLQDLVKQFRDANSPVVVDNLDEEDDEYEDQNEPGHADGFSKTIKVNKFEPTQLSNHFGQIEVSVEDPEIVKLNMLHRKHTSYTVTTLPFGWRVKRRYSDFEWLMKCLVMRFPAHYVLTTLT